MIINKVYRNKYAFVRHAECQARIEASPTPPLQVHSEEEPFKLCLRCGYMVAQHLVDQDHADGYQERAWRRKYKDEGLRGRIAEDEHGWEVVPYGPPSSREVTGGMQEQQCRNSNAVLKGAGWWDDV
jgi:hypothetical protein